MKRALVASCVLSFATLSASGTASELNAPYTNPVYLTGVTFGAHSHWQQPWRAYLETVPATTFVDGTGLVFNVSARQAEPYAEMLSKYGIHHVRFEVGWGSFAYDREDQLDDPVVAPRLAALRRHGIRPVILLNANSSQPCPRRNVRKTVVKGATRGDRTVEFDSVEGIVPGYTGFNHLGNAYNVANVLVVALNGNVATLSKPIPKDIAAGSPVDLVTLKYRPFSRPGNEDYAATIKGWRTYVSNVARIARADLGTTGQPDGGFDLEIWNELTFGSDFLSIKNYYKPANESNYLPASEAHGSPNINALIVKETAAEAEAHPELFSGVQLVDGFSNTVPWPASSTEPPRVSALSKHPYPPAYTYPRRKQPGAGLDAQLQTTSFVPQYHVNFPEYWASFLNTESVIRDMAPISTSYAGALHGRFARTIDGRVAPVPVWITEVNTSPVETAPNITPEAAMAIKAKTSARYYTFFLNKGAVKVDIYAANEHEVGLGIVRHNFIDYVKQNTAYPSDDTPYVSPALQVTGRIVAKMSDGLNRNLTALRPLRVTALSSDNDDIVFHGDGTAASPDLRAVDVFAFLPFQVNEHKFVIPYYVMTRDVMQPWNDDTFHISVAGFSANAHFSAYDPFTNTRSDVSAERQGNVTRIPLRAGDYPRLLIVDDGAS